MTTTSKHTRPIQAGQLGQHEITELCTDALMESTSRAIADDDAIELSEQGRATFFDALVNPPRLNERLQRAFTEHRHRIIPRP
jgi:uncharacterized protein (DUF1778 family)